LHRKVATITRARRAGQRSGSCLRGRQSRIRIFLVWLIAVALAHSGAVLAHSFVGFDSGTLSPVSSAPDNWGLKLVVLNVGQADAILVLTPNGDVTLIDSGKTKTAGNQIADFLDSETLNGVGTFKTIDLLYTTHYDKDHIGGLPRIVERGIVIRKAFDQGISGKRGMTTPTGRKTAYAKYVKAVGDPNNNLIQDAEESNFVRHRIHYGHVETIGQANQVEIRTVSVRGDTKGTNHDLILDPTGQGANFDENPGSIALLVSLGPFEFYTAGDQTDDDWKSKPAVEEALLHAGAIPDGNDVDVLKVSHHGSDTSTSKALVEQMGPEVAIISTKYTRGDRLPKKIVVKQFQENRTYVLITGDGLNTDTQLFTDSRATTEDDSFIPSDEAVFNDQGNVTILVSADGTRYTVIGNSFAKTFSAKDADNQR